MPHDLPPIGADLLFRRDAHLATDDDLTRPQVQVRSASLQAGGLWTSPVDSSQLLLYRYRPN